MLYGRKKTKSFDENNQNIISKYLPELSFDTTKSYTNFVLEIGFGYGEHMIQNAINNSDQLFVGCDIFLNGIYNVINEIKNNNIKNILIFNGDANILLNSFSKESVSELFLLFPDPWPKRRHFKRRFLQKDNIKKVSEVLKTDGIWHIASDHELYQKWVDISFLHNDFFKQNSKNYIKEKYFGTRYEERALLENRKILHYSFQKI